MKKILLTIALACLATLTFAQKSSVLRPRVEIVENDSEENMQKLEVFYMNDVSPRKYWLSVGSLGIGLDIVQVDFDPVYELFIPLGGTLSEATARLEEIKELYKMPRQQSTSIEGCFAPLYPVDSLVTVTVTRRQMLTSQVLEFSLPTGNEKLVRATHIGKSDFGGIVSGLKIYRKIHPKEK